MIDILEIQKILPHRYPFLLIDRVIELKNHEFIKGYKNITIAEEIFQGHFPDHPIYPGVMIIEGMAQIGGVLAFKSMVSEGENLDNKVVYFMSIDKAKFRKPVRPGDRLDYEISVIKRRGKIWLLDSKAYVDGELAAQAELQAMVVDK